MYRKRDHDALIPQIRQLKQEGFTDKAISKRLGIGTSTITAWRQRYRIGYANKFIAHFEAKHGQGAYHRLETLVATGASGTVIGQTFGYTREYGRILKREVQRRWQEGFTQ